jgi:hypothetical protein
VVRLAIFGVEKLRRSGNVSGPFFAQRLLRRAREGGNAPFEPPPPRPHGPAHPNIETLQQTHSAPGVKQQLAAVRMLFDWLIIGQVAPSNPASAVRGPKHVVKTGNTPVLEGNEWRRLIDAIPTDTVRDLRDRALIATLTYGLSRSTAFERIGRDGERQHERQGRIEQGERAIAGVPLGHPIVLGVDKQADAANLISDAAATAPRRTRRRFCSAPAAATAESRSPSSR